MVAIKHSEVGLVRLAAIALVLVLGAGCASPSMISTKDELQSVGENEGIVVGSFLVNIEPGEEKESAWAFLKGRKTGDSEYDVTVTETTGLGGDLMNAALPYRTNYQFRVKPEQEIRFIKKLPAGRYRIMQIKQVDSTAYVNVGAAFTVRPKQPTYIGRMVVRIPYRAMAGTQVSVRVTDAQEETVDALRKEHGEALLSNIVKDLMK
jgi:hypothetical protein